MVLFYENRPVGEVGYTALSERRIRLLENPGLLPGMIVELSIYPQGDRVSGIVDTSAEGEVHIRLEGSLS